MELSDSPQTIVLPGLLASDGAHIFAKHRKQAKAAQKSTEKSTTIQ